LRHLAAAIHHKAAGFITSENALLKKRWILQERFGLDVVGVAELAEFVTPTQWTEHEHRITHSPTKQDLIVREMSERERGQVEAFLLRLALPAEVLNNALAPGHKDSPRRRLVVAVTADIVAFASWDAPQRLFPDLDSYLFVNERHSTAESSIELALYLLMRDSCRLAPAVVRLYLNAHPGGLASRLAGESGFRGPDGRHTIWRKVCLGRIVDVTGWNETARQLAQAADLTLPSVPPTYRGPDTSIAIAGPDGKSLTVTLHEFENLIGPALLLFPQRCGTVVPIRATFADQLLDPAPQGGLFPRYEASLLPRRTYFSHPRTLPALLPGTILFFYESRKHGGRGAVIACARSVANSSSLAGDVEQSAARRDVIEAETIQRFGGGGRTCVTTFDTIFRFAKPVPFARLRLLRCADASNLVTSRPIRYDQLLMLIQEGEPHV
jgi:hypothetical protein